MFRRVIFPSLLFASLIAASATPPTWWASRGATDSNPLADDAAVNQGQLKHFTQKAVEELNAWIPGGAGPELNGLVSGWMQAYESGGYNAGNPLPADFNAMTSGQLKWIASKIHARLVFAKYEDASPGWLVQNAATDNQLANLGQLKTVFNFDLTAPAGELPLWWQKFYFNGQTGIDPNGDADGDGLTNAQEFASGIDPSNGNTGGDSKGDADDADPTDPLVNWVPVADSSYIMIDVDVPTESAAQDLNDKGEVLFSDGIWVGGDWIAKDLPQITGVFPDSADIIYPDGISYESDTTANWWFFNNDRTLLQTGALHPTEGPGIDTWLSCPIFWTDAGSGPVVARNSTNSGSGSSPTMPQLMYETAGLWDNVYWNTSSVGMSSAGDMIVRATDLLLPDGVTEATERLDRFDKTGSRTGSMDGVADFHPEGYYRHGQVSSSGWVVSNLYRKASDTLPAKYKVGLWNASNAAVALPAEADGWGYPVTATDLPNGKVGVVAGQTSGSITTGRVFLPDASGNYTFSEKLSSQHLLFFAGDGTAITSDNQLWRNGKLTPLRELSESFGKLLDEGYNIFPVKANKNGTYLIEAQKESGESVTKLLLPAQFDLRNTADFDKGWDDTDPDVKKGPWTCCGVNRKKADGTDYPNSIMKLVLPGCTAELAALLELVPEGNSAGYLTLANQAITGDVTAFDIQGKIATPPGSACQIVVREKGHPANKSRPLNVRVFAPRVVKFQVYRANPPATPDTGFVATVDQINTELNTAYNEQANIKFVPLQPNIVNAPNITGIFDSSGNLPEANARLLRDKIHDDFNPNNHLKIILVKGIVSTNTHADLAGLAGFREDWAMVMANVSQLDTYSHEVGHSFDFIAKKDGGHHEFDIVKAPTDEIPLMHHTNGSSHWIRQEDWVKANTEADNPRYGK